MRTLHDAATRREMVSRVQSLRPDSARLWGRMTIDQMLWHVNQGLMAALGEIELPPPRMPVLGFLLLPLVLHLPWPKGAPTAPQFVAGGAHDFQQEREQLLQLLGAFAERERGGHWPTHAGFGRMSGKHWSRMMYRHLDHHLRQFSA